MSQFVIERKVISERAEILRSWQDFLNKYMNICFQDEYNPINNPEGYINLGTAVNNMCSDVILPRLTSTDVWSCNTSYLQYREGYGIMRLRRALATILNEFFNPSTVIDPENIFCMVGVTACIDVLAHCIADPGDVILVPTPVYGRIYTDFMQRSQVKMYPIPIIARDNTEDSPVLTLEKVKKAFDEALSKKHIVRGIFLINPSNPLGDIYSPKLLMDIFNFCKEHNLHVIVDEVYALSVFNESPEFYSALRFPTLPDRDRIHILYGISKDFGIAGLRIGAIHTWNKTLQNCLKELSFFHNIPFPVMDIAARFVEDLDWSREYLLINQKRLTEKFTSCVDILKEMGLNVRNSEAAFFLWVDFRPVCGSKSFDQERDFFLYLIEKYHLYIVPGQEFFCEQPGWFRLTFTSFPDQFEVGLRRLEKSIKNYQSLKL